MNLREERLVQSGVGSGGDAQLWKVVLGHHTPCLIFIMTLFTELCLKERGVSTASPTHTPASHLSSSTSIITFLHLPALPSFQLTLLQITFLPANPPSLPSLPSFTCSITFLPANSPSNYLPSS
ncbi:hypothetical protein Pcinc_042981 [Petrolisthes cinctipes]|uniref:Uncharacterized protein n=1 Tax=Petrolisthes cinctipes TaxID=88211 RepID=A0AAE1BJL8_PETCI|nr:hypothetical protein Pcinc_042981 [Petrolisthes cinctipes]